MYSNQKPRACSEDNSMGVAKPPLKISLVEWYSNDSATLAETLPGWTEWILWDEAEKACPTFQTL